MISIPHSPRLNKLNQLTNLTKDCAAVPLNGVNYLGRLQLIYHDAKQSLNLQLGLMQILKYLIISKGILADTFARNLEMFAEFLSLSVEF